MDTIEVTSEPATTPSKKKPSKKRKMSAEGRKAISEAAKARWAAKQAAPVESAPSPAQPVVPNVPAAPSPAVLQLQDQVVSLVSQRHQARTFLNETHNAYLAAQAKFQSAENELKGIEAEVQYRIGLIAQLENRPAQVSYSPPPAPVLQMPASLAGVSSEPAQPQTQIRGPQQNYAIGDANDLRKELRGMM